MSRYAGVGLVVALLVLAACGSDSGYSAGAEKTFVAGCSKAAAKSVGAKMGGAVRTPEEMTALTSYCRAALSCIELSLSPDDFVKASEALAAKQELDQKASNAFGACTRTASASTNLAAAFAHDYPPPVRRAFQASCRSTALATVSKSLRGKRLTATGRKAIATYCDGALACTEKAVTVDDLAALQDAMKAGKPRAPAVSAAIKRCAAANLPALRAALKSRSQ
jgi:hypothetical protein